MQTPYSQHTVTTAWHSWWVIQVCPVHKHSSCCNLISTLCVTLCHYLPQQLYTTHPPEGNQINCSGCAKTTLLHLKPHFNETASAQHSGCVVCALPLLHIYNIEHCMLWMPIRCPSRMHGRTNAHMHSHTAWSRICSRQELVMLAHIKRLLYYSCRSHIASTVLQLHGTPDGSFKSVLFTNTAAAAI